MNNAAGAEENGDLALDAGFAERFKEIVKSVKGVQRLAEMSQIRASQIYKWQKGEGATFENMARICGVTGYSLDWLATGRGTRFVDVQGAMPDQQLVQGMTLPGAGEISIIASDFVLVPRYEVRASAGGGALVEAENVIERVAYRLDWIRSMKLDPNHLMCAEADGDSMDPTISDGDLLLIDTRVTNPRSEGIYFMRFGDGLVVKRLQLRPDGGANLISDNAARYEPQRLSREELGDLQILGRVRWRGGRV